MIHESKGGREVIKLEETVHVIMPFFSMSLRWMQRQRAFHIGAHHLPGSHIYTLVNCLVKQAFHYFESHYHRRWKQGGTRGTFPPLETYTLVVPPFK